MGDLADSIDITTDLNGSAADAVPATGDAVHVNAQDVPTQPQVQPQVQPSPPEADAPPAKEQPPSLRDRLSDAFKGAEAPKAGDDAKPAPEAPQPKIDAPELVKVGERFHRKDGSFASREEIDAFNAAQAPGSPPVLPQWADKLTQLEQQQFNALPAEIRQFVERTMDGVNTRGAQYEEYGLLEQVIGPRREAWAQGGMTPLVALNNLFALSDFAGRDPGQFVLWFADQNKVDLDALLDARDAAMDGQQSNPQLLGLQQEIAQLKNVINGFSTTTMQTQQQRAYQVVTEFANEKGADGKPLRPYFNDLATEISQHAAMIRQSQPHLQERDILSAAYDFAAYSNPAIRDRMQQDNMKALQDKAAADAARARQAGVSINGGPAGDTSKLSNNANRTVREHLIAAYNDSVSS